MVLTTIAALSALMLVLPFYIIERPRCTQCNCIGMPPQAPDPNGPIPNPIPLVPNPTQPPNPNPMPNPGLVAGAVSPSYPTPHVRIADVASDTTPTPVYRSHRGQRLFL